MKQILCYGDSNTWGFIPGTKERYPWEIRWTGIGPLDAAILMLGTNDCKAHYNNSAYEIGKGLEQCIDILLKDIPANRILVISPIHLGRDVWKKEKETVEFFA